jgi:tRNA(Arg) A34 adenosine deaminase TadA
MLAAELQAPRASTETQRRTDCLVDEATSCADTSALARSSRPSPSGCDGVPWGDVTVYVTIEPCVMCASLLMKLGVKRVVYGAANPKFGYTSLFPAPTLSYEMTGGVCAREAVDLLKHFYVRSNARAPG